MFRALFGNTLISTAAFLVVGLIGLLIVPVLLSAYGLTGLGLIMTARLFLPGAGLGLFDFGVSEIATQTVATARVDGDWPRAHRRLSALTMLTLAMAVIVALPVLVFSAQLAAAFGVNAGDLTAFKMVLDSTAALLPVLFVGLLVEGCLKGFENFRALRGSEVLSTLLFAGGAVVLSQAGLAFQWIVWLHLATQLLRAGFIARALARASHEPMRLRRDIDIEARDYVRERAKVFFASRLLGTAQHQSPAVLIGLTVGPQGVGLYEMLARLPKFAKSVLGILNTTLLPFATRLDAAGDEARLRLLNVFGFTLLPALVFPPVVAAAALAGPTLNIWIGENFVRYAPWLALFWALPALNTIVSFQNYTLISRMAYVKASNQIAAAQVIFQTVVSLALVSLLDQFAFIVGYVGASALLFGWQLTLARRTLRTPPAMVVRLLALSLVFVVLVVGVQFGAPIALPPGLTGFVLGFLLITALLAGATFALFLGPAERSMAGQIVAMARRRKR